MNDFGKHGKALENTLANPKLPKSDINLIQIAIAKYNAWIEELNQFKLLTNEGLEEENIKEYLCHSIESLNKYKNFVDLNIIYDSEHNFLYRNKGQLKLCNTIMEEFLERTVATCLDLPKNGLEVGSVRCVSSVFFDLYDEKDPIKTVNKDQDCAVIKNISLEILGTKKELKIPLVAIECKTYIDKTMFQEAVGTAARMKQLCPRSKYFILAEWLDMTPVDTSNTGIDRVFILRKAKRFRDDFGGSLKTLQGRQEKRDLFFQLLENNKINEDVFIDLVYNIQNVIKGYTINTDQILKLGYF